MAHDVWLFRRSLIACLFLSIFLGYNAKGTNTRAVATDRGFLSDIKESPSKAFPSQALHHLIKKSSSKAEHMKQKIIQNVKNKSRRTRVHPRLKRTRLKESHKNHLSKKTLIERNQVTDANRRRMQVLDSYFVHPRTMKEPSLPESNFPRSKEWLQSALLLDGLQPRDSNSEMHLQKVGSELLTTQNLDREMPSHFLDWSRKGFRTGELKTVQGPLNAETYDENSVEGQKIVNTASVVHRFNESPATGVINSLKHQGEKVIDGAGAFQTFHPTNSSLGSKQTYRYKFINSLIKPQLAGILADLQELDAQRHRANPVDFKVLKNDHKLAAEKEVKEEKAGQNLTKQENVHDMQTEGENTEKKSEPQYHANDMFILGALNRSTYVHDLFLANPVPINHLSGSEAAYEKYKERLKKLQTTLKVESQFEKLHESGFHNSSKEDRAPPHVHTPGGTAAVNHDGSFNKEFDRFHGSGFKESVYSGEKWDSNGSGLKFDTRFGSQSVPETVRKLKPTSRITLQSLKDKAMKHIEEKSDKDGSGVIYFSGKTSSNTQKVRVSSYFRPTGGQAFPKVTTVSSFKRTTIAHVESGSDSDLESWTVSSGEGSVSSGSGEDEAFLHKHYHKPKPTLKPLSSSRKTHTGILGVTDKETRSKCEKMGKSDFREQCPHGWLLFEQFCYFFVPHPVRKWDEFPPKCNENNALLAMPKTDKQLGFLQDKISSSKYKMKYFYIGLKKNDGAWKWIDDMPYTRNVNVTDELGTKNCSALSKDSEMHMVTCNEPKAGYVCELRTGVKAISVLALGDSLTSGFHSEDKSHTPYAKTLEYLLNKDVHRCYTLTTVARDGIEASEISALLQNHLRNSSNVDVPRASSSVTGHGMERVTKPKNICVGDHLVYLFQYFTWIANSDGRNSDDEVFLSIPSIAKSKYAWVIILAGTNDILHNSGHSTEKAWDTAVHNIIDLHIMSHRFGAKTMAVTIPEMDCEESDKPPCQRTRLERQYINEKIRHYARTNEFTILCDLATKFPRYSLKSEERNQFWEEGLHMKTAGYERMAEIIYRDLLVHIDDDESLK